MSPWAQYLDPSFWGVPKRLPAPEPDIEFAEVQDDDAARKWLDESAAAAGEAWKTGARRMAGRRSQGGTDRTMTGEWP